MLVIDEVFNAAGTEFAQLPVLWASGSELVVDIDGFAARFSENELPRDSGMRPLYASGGVAGIPWRFSFFMRCTEFSSSFWDKNESL